MTQNLGELVNFMQKKPTLDGSNGHPVFNQTIPGDRVKGQCLLSQMVPLQLVGKVPGRDVPFILWDNKVGEPYHIVSVKSEQGAYNFALHCTVNTIFDLNNLR